MAEKEKKAKAPAKPRKSASTKEPAAKPAPLEIKPAQTKPAQTKPAQMKPAETKPVVTHEEIRRRAHQLWAERGYQIGSPEKDWLRAEEELLQKAS